MHRLALADLTREPPHLLKRHTMLSAGKHPSRPGTATTGTAPPFFLERQLEREVEYTGCYLSDSPFAPFAHTIRLP